LGEWYGSIIGLLWLIDSFSSTPPELDMLEVGDLAEDRFRGIFKMSYTGDAFLTLKTRVQANPLNTALSAKPAFASPQPLAAASGLTIPLQITLSDIRLSGFVILVFSRQKGLTLVFQNDPLESLKVSSTFDSIPFVRDYLQKEIEGQLRVLFMEDLPAILHRLSLRLWSPEYAELEDERIEQEAIDTTAPIDPLASPPQDAVDAFGNPLNEGQPSPFSLDPTSETHSSFSQKNLIRLAALTESHRTLSLFTPAMRETIFRAWAGAAERIDGSTTPSLTQSSLSRIQSSFGNTKSTTPSLASGSTGNESASSRPTLHSFTSSQNGLGLGPRPRTTRKRKTRVVNLRKDKTTTPDDASSTAADTSATSIAISTPASIPEEREEDLATPPRSPVKPTHPKNRHSTLDVGEPAILPESSLDTTPTAPLLSEPPKTPRASPSRPPPSHARRSHPSTPLLRNLSLDKIQFQSASASGSSTSRTPLSPTQYAESSASGSGGILEQAWMTKMANEIARRVQVEKDKEARGVRESGNRKVGGFWEREDSVEGEVGAGLAEAPPAYEA
jgi:distribution and morphology protein 34